MKKFKAILMVFVAVSVGLVLSGCVLLPGAGAADEDPNAGLNRTMLNPPRLEQSRFTFNATQQGVVFMPAPETQFNPLIMREETTSVRAETGIGRYEIRWTLLNDNYAWSGTTSRTIVIPWDIVPAGITYAVENLAGDVAPGRMVTIAPSHFGADEAIGARNPSVTINEGWWGTSDDFNILFRHGFQGPFLQNLNIATINSHVPGVSAHRVYVRVACNQTPARFTPITVDTLVRIDNNVIAGGIVLCDECGFPEEFCICIDETEPTQTLINAPVLVNNRIQFTGELITVQFCAEPGSTIVDERMTIDMESSTLSATGVGTYMIFITLIDTENYRWADVSGPTVLLIWNIVI